MNWVNGCLFAFGLILGMKTNKCTFVPPKLSTNERYMYEALLVAAFPVTIGFAVGKYMENTTSICEGNVKLSYP